MTPFTAQTPHNHRCWGSVSARCPVWVITPGSQLIYFQTINPAVHTCCPLQCPSVLVQLRVWCIFFVCSVLLCRGIRHCTKMRKTFILKFSFEIYFTFTSSLWLNTYDITLKTELFLKVKVKIQLWCSLQLTPNQYNTEQCVFVKKEDKEMHFID